ncbi:MAG: T9SS type A sorting domain-containing protein [Chitinophagaceae bacterium]|nr:T9SS type A sorting domain-containing protein [Chitinophagaceae bacterium]
MKTLLSSFILIILTALTSEMYAQTYSSYQKGLVFNFTQNTVLSGNNFPDQCDACKINIADGVTVTFNKNIALSKAEIKGGNIVLNNKMEIWTSASLTNVNITVNNGGEITSSGNIVATNTQFVFKGNATITLWAKTDMNNSKMTFLDNSGLVATAAVNLTNSSLTAGDGANKSKAFIKFDGGTLNLFDKGYVSIMGSNNYYYNWSAYKANGKNVSTSNNKLNCGTPGTNACQNPMMYGPSILNLGGMSIMATLPVRLSAFSVKLTGTRVDIAWVSDMELNFDHYEIERSFDGANWSTIGTVQSTGNAGAVSRYTFTDALKLAGAVNYRLKMVDIDGTSVYSPIKTVKAGAAIEMTVFPNPATDYIMINAGDNASHKVQIISYAGQLLKQVAVSGKERIAVSGLTPGNYVVRAIDENGLAKNFKLVIQ